MIHANRKNDGIGQKRPRKARKAEEGPRLGKAVETEEDDALESEDDLPEWVKEYRLRAGRLPPQYDIEFQQFVNRVRNYFARGNDPAASKESSSSQKSVAATQTTCPEASDDLPLDSGSHGPSKSTKATTSPSDKTQRRKRKG